MAPTHWFVVLAPLLSTSQDATPGGVTLEAAFHAFAQCASESARVRLDERLKFFTAAGLRSEEEVKKLPEHERKNEQEQVLSLQETLIPRGAVVVLSGLTKHHELNGCEGIVIECLRDGSFRCAVDIEACAASAGADVRVRVHNLRPVARCASDATPAPFTRDNLRQCQDDAAEPAEELELPLSEQSIGLVMARAGRSYSEMVTHATLPDGAAALGTSNYPDLPYAAMVMIFARLRSAACAALLGGDIHGAARAVEHARELEAGARAPTLEVYNLPRGVRASLSGIARVAAAVRLANDDADGAREEGRLARRLNVSAALSRRQLSAALAPYHDAPSHAPSHGGGGREIRRLQRWWWDELVPLDDEEEAARVPPAQRLDGGSISAALRARTGEGGEAEGGGGRRRVGISAHGQRRDSRDSGLDRQL